MGRLAGVAAFVVLLCACGANAQTAAHSPSPSPIPTPTPVVSPSEGPATPTPTPTPTPSPSPSPSPPPVPLVTCHGGGGAAAMVLIGSGPYSPALLYDVSNPVRPRVLCSISNTSAHLFTGDTFEYLKPVSPNETDVILQSLGSGNESVAGRFPFNAAFGSWLPDLSVMAYATPGPADSGLGGSTQVWLYSQNRLALLYTYPIGIGDCICRFGLPPQVLAVSPDGQYLVAGWLSGKGSAPLAVYRISDRKLVQTLNQDVMSAFWSRTGHRLFVVALGPGVTQSWTPEGGLSKLAGAPTVGYLAGMSPDDSEVAYTAYADPNTQVQPRVYVYDLKAGTTRMLIDKLRTQRSSSRTVGCGTWRSAPARRPKGVLEPPSPPAGSMR